MDKFAVIDTETNWNDEVMSIGVVVADSHTRKKIDAVYYIFDPEYSGYEWYDIMRLAAYRQYNSAIPGSADCCKTGRLKRGYSVEDVLKMLGKCNRYSETHNAVLDARDELEIMRLLGYGIEEYSIAFAAGKKVGEDIYFRCKGGIGHAQFRSTTHS